MKTLLPTIASLCSLTALASGQSALVEGQQALAVETYATLAEEDGTSNLIFSPTSIQAVLAMIAEGAAGDTRTEMLPFLDPAGDGNTLATDFGDLASSLTSEDIEVSLVTAFYSDTGFPIESDYLDLLDEAFGAHRETIEFTPPDAVIDDANAWVEDATNGKIEDLVTADLFTELTKTLWLSAQYIKGDWEIQFAEELTRSGNFYGDNGSIMLADFMSHRFYNVVRRDTENQIMSAELPLVDNDYAAVFLRPLRPEEMSSVPALSTLEERLSPELLRNHLAMELGGDYRISLPKFSFETEFPLESTFKALGIETAFTNDADFSNLTAEGNFALFRGRHKAIIEATEGGLEAAGASAMTGGVTSAPTPYAFDYPFLVLVYHKPTQAFLFMGRVSQPTVSEDTPTLSPEQAALFDTDRLAAWGQTWLLYVNTDERWPWFESVPYGWFYALSNSTASSAWLYHLSEGWIWTRKDLMPVAWSANHGWVYQYGEAQESYPPQTGGLWWYRYNDGQWLEITN